MADTEKKRPTKELLYRTVLSPEECLRRIQEHSYSIRNLFVDPLRRAPEGTIFTRVQGMRVTLAARGPKYVRNSWELAFYGVLEPCDDGTRVRGRFRMHPFVRAFMRLWFGGLYLMVIVVIMITLFSMRTPSSGKSPIIAVFALGAMGTFGFGLVKLGQILSADQVAAVKRYIEKDLEARLETETDLSQ
jgi:hypothetical protein